MIAIFTLLGLVLFGGGLYGVYDGWPYLVLERGFTEVIIGSLSATAGLIMLSLAWVLKELKGLRRELVAAHAVGPDVSVPVEPASPAAPLDVPAVEVTAPSPAVASPFVPVALGAGAAAVAAVVADKAETAAPGAETPERDLFGGLVASHLASAPDEDEHRQEEPSEPEPVEALPDMFETEADEAPARSEAGHPIAVEAESHEPVEIVAAHIRPVSQDEALAHSDDEAEAMAELGERAALEEPLHPEAEEPAGEGRPAAEAGSAGRDEFAVLRESLSSQLGGLERPAERIEPSFTRDDPFAAAEAWMQPSERREPHFDLTPPEAAEPPLVWPPRTEAHRFGEVASKATEEAEAFTAPEEIGADEIPDQPASSHHVEADAPEAPEVEAPEQDDSPEAAPEPAASEEGIVGAYQVGEAHFTIYADGSIRARTPDGEYSFASMDELKVYLASEKSRLGV